MEEDQSDNVLSELNRINTTNSSLTNSENRTSNKNLQKKSDIITGLNKEMPIRFILKNIFLLVFDILLTIFLNSISSMIVIQISLFHFVFL